jgi:hypothetical protein
MANGTLYPLAWQLRHVANEMFGVRIYRTTTGSNFRHIDVVVFDEELSLLEVDKYMTARQAKNSQLRLIDEARRSARRIRRKYVDCFQCLRSPIQSPSVEETRETTGRFESISPVSCHHQGQSTTDAPQFSKRKIGDQRRCSFN